MAEICYINNDTILQKIDKEALLPVCLANKADMSAADLALVSEKFDEIDEVIAKYSG